MSEEARAAILARIRGALQDAPEQPAEAPRAYRRNGTLDAQARAGRLEERLVEYGVHVERTGAEGAPAVIRARLAERGRNRLLAPDGLPPAWRVYGVDWVDEEEAGPAELDRLDGVVTGCALAIAETGTLVLDGGAGQGRRAASLIPDYHLCVIEGERIVELVPEAVAALGEAIANDRPLTMISGPSATSDIELMRVAGVHGPRTLDVVLLERR